MPRALALIRAFGAAGHRVITCDTAAHVDDPSAHSRFAAEAVAVPAPAADPTGYVAAVARLVREHGVDLVMPQFEEILYLAQAADLLGAPMFAPPFPTLVELHDKARFQALCAGLGLPVPRTVVVRSGDELRAALEGLAHYVAKPAYSRGGLRYLTDTGPRAGELRPEDCDPTPANPWLVQEYVDGDDVCSLSIVREGRVVVHCAYRPTVQMVTGASIQFTSEEDFGALPVVERIARGSGLTGVIGLDMRLDGEGRPVLLECNPRCTNGLFLIPDEWVVDAIVGAPQGCRTVPAGRRRQWDLELLIPRFNRLPPWRTARELLSGTDPTFTLHDLEPGLVMMGNLLHFTVHMLRGGHDLVSSFEEDVVWDGQTVDRAELRGEPARPAGPA